MFYHNFVIAEKKELAAKKWKLKQRKENFNEEKNHQPAAVLGHGTVVDPHRGVCQR